MNNARAIELPVMLLLDMIRREQWLQIASPAECLDSVDRERFYTWLLVLHMHDRRN